MNRIQKEILYGILTFTIATLIYWGLLHKQYIYLYYKSFIIWIMILYILAVIANRIIDSIDFKDLFSHSK